MFLDFNFTFLINLSFSRKHSPLARAGLNLIYSDYSKSPATIFCHEALFWRWRIQVKYYIILKSNIENFWWRISLITTATVSVLFQQWSTRTIWWKPFAISKLIIFPAWQGNLIQFETRVRTMLKNSPYTLRFLLQPANHQAQNHIKLRKIKLVPKRKYLLTSGGRHSGIEARAFGVPLPDGVSNKWMKDSILDAKVLLSVKIPTSIPSGTV